MRPTGSSRPDDIRRAARPRRAFESGCTRDFRTRGCVPDTQEGAVPSGQAGTYPLVVGCACARASCSCAGVCPCPRVYTTTRHQSVVEGVVEEEECGATGVRPRAIRVRLRA
eukprot:879916-Prymnesium_polylepis.1